MGKLPKRRILRVIVHDAIGDREEFKDPSIVDETEETIRKYRALLVSLGDNDPPLTTEMKDTLAQACHHARYWREGFLDAIAHTGDKDLILKTKQEIAQIDRTEVALGVSYKSAMQIALENAPLVSIFDLMKERQNENQKEARRI